MAEGLGDLLRHEPLLRGLSEKYPGINIQLKCMNLSKAQILRDVPNLSFCQILSYRFDIIVNCYRGYNDYEFMHQKNKNIIGFTSPTTATNQAAADEWIHISDYDDIPADEICRRRANAPRKNISQRLCEITDIFPEDGRIHYTVSAEEKQWAKDFIKDIDKPVVVLHTCTEGFLKKPESFDIGDDEWDRLKEWTPKDMFKGMINSRDTSLDNFKEFIKLNPDYHFIAIGAENDRKMLEYLAEETNCTISISGLRNNLSLLSVARYFVGVDSGPSHVAYALDVPSLVLYIGLFKHASVPVKPQVNHIMFSKDILTMKNITVQDVHEQFQKLIALNS